MRSGFLLAQADTTANFIGVAIPSK